MFSAENIKKSFEGEEVIKNFSHVFKEGGTTAIVGASGCGKTTLLNILMGLLPPDGGEVKKPENTRFSAVFQEDRLCENLTASANIRLVTGKRFSKKEIADYLEKVGLSDCADKRASDLSGGMKRRTALLRALLAEYDILFLDEPFKGLDEATKAQVIDFTAQMTKNKTVIMVTHDPEECQKLSAKIINL